MAVPSQKPSAGEGVLVHEWLARTGGSENVFEAMSAAFPSARRFALWNDSDGRFDGVAETWLARTPFRRSKALSLPLMPLAWRQLPSVDADWVLISSHVFAHHARFGGTARDAPKLVYAHTPARYVWVPELDGRGESAAARAVSAALKPLDRKRAQEPLAIAANSQFVAERIGRTWKRESSVIYPPVDVAAFSAPPDLDESQSSAVAALPADFLLGVSRFVPYKRLDHVIRAGALTGRPVVLAGSGPDEQRLRALAEEVHPGEVTFVNRPDMATLRAIYRRAAAVVFAPIEDFGIIPVEAMASGTPVVANAVGGAAESVVDGLSGALVLDWDDDDEVRAAVGRALAAKPEDITGRAELFSADRFRVELRKWVEVELDGRATH